MPVDSASMPSDYHFLLPAWGEKYIKVFLAFKLPSHMSPGNIGVIPPEKTLLRIYTRSQDVDVFRSSALFREYERTHPVIFELIDDLQLVQNDPYRTLTACQERGLKSAVDTDTAFFFLNPDAVYSDGTYRAILDRFREGKRAIMTQGLRASLPAFSAQLERLRPAPGVWPTLPPRVLVRLLLDNLHPLSVAHFMNGDGNRSIGSYYWPVGKDGLIGRCIHTHPMAVRPLHKITRLYTTIDHEYVRMSCPDPDTVHLVTDTDEFAAVELSSPEHLADWVKTENIPNEEIYSWMRDWTNIYHRNFFRKVIVVHAGEITPEYDEAIQASNTFTDKILSEFDRRYPEAGDTMAVVSQAIRWEHEAAEAARLAEVTRVAQEAAELEARTRAAEETTKAQATAQAHAAQFALAAQLAAMSPSLSQRLVRKAKKGILKVHRLLNRPLYNRGDRLVETVRTLIEQRRIDDSRIQQLESARNDLESKMAQAWQYYQASAAQQKELMQMLSQQGQQICALRQQLTALESRQSAETKELQGSILDVSNRLIGVKYTHDRLLTLLSRSGVISFSDRDPTRPTSQPPLGYSDYDMATLVYRPAFERAIRYLQGTSLSGCVAEFGTYRGFTAQTFAELLRDINWPSHLYLYDSFAGLPAPTGRDATSYEMKREAWVEGAMTPEPDIVARIQESVSQAIGAERLHIHAGFFDRSLPVHPPAEPVAILHMDADLYSSARYVLQELADKNLIRDGAVLLMDDFNCNFSNPTMGERKALTDFLAENPRWSCSPWFAYGWHGHAYFLHDSAATPTSAG